MTVPNTNGKLTKLLAAVALAGSLFAAVLANLNYQGLNSELDRIRTVVVPALKADVKKQHVEIQRSRQFFVDALRRAVRERFKHQDGQPALKPRAVLNFTFVSAKEPIRCWGRKLTTGCVPSCRGTSKVDNITGTPGSDVIWAGRGDDSVFGDGGNDWLCGGKGDDVLFGDPGSDHVSGGPGFDTCVGEHLRKCE